MKQRLKINMGCVTHNLTTNQSIKILIKNTIIHLETCYDLVVDELKLDDQGSTLVAHLANPPTASSHYPWKWVSIISNQEM